MQRPRWSLRRARALVGTKFLLIVGLVGFVGLAWLIERIAGLHEPIAFGPVVAAAMAGVPAVLWLAFFYLMDRHEPEPKQLVAGVCALGALIAAPLADFVQAHLAPAPGLAVPGVSLLSLDRILLAVLVVGLSQEVSKYAVVRYTIYLSREFDEPMDGVVYMMSVGTGFAVLGAVTWTLRVASPVIVNRALSWYSASCNFLCIWQGSFANLGRH